MSNHLTYEAWPVVCEDCAAVTTANFIEEPLVCKQCDGSTVTQIFDKRNWRGDGESVVSWNGRHLTNGHYRCPSCGEFELRFAHGDLMWD